MAFDLPNSRHSGVRDWLSEHGDAAVNAATFVGDARAGAAVRTLIQEISATDVLNLRHLRRLGQLRDLLSGEGPDLDRCVDPMDHRLDDFCLLAESLSRLLGDPD